MTNDILVTKKNSPAEKAKRLMELQVSYKDIKTEMDILKADLLQVMQDQDVLTLKTGSYTLSRAHRVTPQVIDFELLQGALSANNIPFETKRVFDERMNPVFKTLIEEGREMPGLDSLITEYVSIRVKEKEVKPE